MLVSCSLTSSRVISISLLLARARRIASSRVSDTGSAEYTPTRVVSEAEDAVTFGAAAGGVASLSSVRTGSALRATTPASCASTAKGAINIAATKQKYRENDLIYL